MKLYRLAFTLHEPTKDSGGKYVAEVPTLPGCRAWGETSAEALEHLQSVAAAFIESYRDHGDPLPVEVEQAASETDSPAFSEVLVAV
jgi:predicted RNase H-like HicB family nuclease